jgi:hypothetical protein
MKIGADKTAERELAFLAPRRPFYLPAPRLAILASLFSDLEKEKRWRNSRTTK